MAGLRPPITRRRFLRASIDASAALLLGCDESEPARVDPGPACGEPDAFADGELVGQASFVNEGDLPLDTLVGEGLDGRLYTDLSTLEGSSPLVETERFYVRTRYPDLLNPSAPWLVELDGLVEAPQQVTLEELSALSRPLGTYVLECSGNSRQAHFGLLSAARWGGVPLAELIDRVRPLAGATQVLVTGFDEHSMPSEGAHSTPGASWVFALGDIDQTGAFLATEMNDAPLSPDHGAPVRLFVPGWYGCTAIKWVNRVTLVGNAEPRTSQMVEFADRTHQPSAFELAREYRPAIMQPAAIPVRVEKWRVAGRIVYRAVGVLWGGERLGDSLGALEVRFGEGRWERVDSCSTPDNDQTWALWAHRWTPERTGVYSVALRINDPMVVSLRLDNGYYVRQAAIDEV